MCPASFLRGERKFPAQIYANMHPLTCQREGTRPISSGGAAVGEAIMADVKVQDGIISVKDLQIQDPRAVAVLMEYPEARWAEITRRALKIGLGYLKGGAQD
jgi:hypothetical protein